MHKIFDFKPKLAKLLYSKNCNYVMYESWWWNLWFQTKTKWPTLLVKVVGESSLCYTVKDWSFTFGHDLYNLGCPKVVNTRMNYVPFTSPITTFGCTGCTIKDCKQRWCKNVNSKKVTRCKRVVHAQIPWIKPFCTISLQSLLCNSWFGCASSDAPITTFGDRRLYRSWPKVKDQALIVQQKQSWSNQAKDCTDCKIHQILLPTTLTNIVGHLVLNQVTIFAMQ